MVNFLRKIFLATTERHTCRVKISYCNYNKISHYVYLRSKMCKQIAFLHISVMHAFRNVTITVKFIPWTIEDIGYWGVRYMFHLGHASLANPNVRSKNPSLSSGIAQSCTNNLNASILCFELSLHYLIRIPCLVFKPQFRFPLTSFIILSFVYSILPILCYATHNSICGVCKIL